MSSWITAEDPQRHEKDDGVEYHDAPTERGQRRHRHPGPSDGYDVAGKTGTTSDDHDRYFAGYTPYYTACVWCGFDSQDEIVLTGNRTNPAIVMWRRVMSKLHEGLENKPFFDTGNMKTVTI